MEISEEIDKLEKRLKELKSKQNARTQEQLERDCDHIREYFSSLAEQLCFLQMGAKVPESILAGSHSSTAANISRRLPNQKEGSNINFEPEPVGYDRRPWWITIFNDQEYNAEIGATGWSFNYNIEDYGSSW